MESRAGAEEKKVWRYWLDSSGWG